MPLTIEGRRRELFSPHSSYQSNWNEPCLLRDMVVIYQDETYNRKEGVLNASRWESVRHVVERHPLLLQKGNSTQRKTKAVGGVDVRPKGPKFRKQNSDMG